MLGNWPGCHCGMPWANPGGWSLRSRPLGINQGPPLHWAGAGRTAAVVETSTSIAACAHQRYTSRYHLKSFAQSLLFHPGVQNQQLLATDLVNTEQTVGY